MEKTHCLSPRHQAIGLLVALIFAAPLQAFATLGGDAASIETDRTAMGAAAGNTVYGAGYTVQTFTLPSTTVVREFLSTNGVVFGVAWEGPVMPNIKELLGQAQFSAVDSSARTRNREGRRGPMEMRPAGASNLVVDSTGHMRAFAGRAYLTDKIPTGVDADAIR